MNDSGYILGIDIGSVCAHIALIDQEENILGVQSSYHHGEVQQTIAALLKNIELEKISWVSGTGNIPPSMTCTKNFDGHLSRIRAVRHLHDKFDALLHIGGEKFSLSRFDAGLNYLGSKHNTSCAAGTGSFLDQQARRLNLPGGACEIGSLALENTGKIPEIATRCAVFAKTDLIHAQQEGYNIGQICDGLCHGLAKNIANTLFKYDQTGSRIIFCGGVASNRSVQQHIESITGHTLTKDDFSKQYGAIGAAFCLLDQLREKQELHEPPIQKVLMQCADDLFSEIREAETLTYPPLALNLSTYPDFNCFRSYRMQDVECDLYVDPATIRSTNGFLGMDVGSTSTKSILIDDTGNPVAGFYTKTASRPVTAVQKILQAYDDFFETSQVRMQISGCGTTGSGRRISGKIIGADIEPDEITAHAVAACELNKNVDTIIEIGGQDAKFTLLKDGVVTSSVMNTVCAAGTGSFIEEQALKLECPLSEYSARAEGVNAPVASDRCTVFMERDINYYLAQGYTKNEILASVLHSVRDNYLTKVANVAQIGECILFQGATAKNKALVAAFEQKLKKPIHVSKYCHLTGALGVALLAREQGPHKSNFRGFDLWQKEIPVRQEVCDLCTNHCKLTLADIDGETLAYGFLCGRDYQTKKKITLKRDNDLLRLRKKAESVSEKSPLKSDFTVGIPAGLHLAEDTDFWEFFFSRLGIKTITSKNLKQPVSKGKSISGAEFCAPMVALHGHVAEMLARADYVFLPFYFEEKPVTKDRRRQHCYYTQFAPSVISCGEWADSDRILSPTIKYLYTAFHTKLELYKTLKKISTGLSFSFFDISSAYDGAVKYRKQKSEALSEIYRSKKDMGGNMNVVFLGRPYTVLSPAMNNNIPYLFENLGVNTFYQDMIDFSDHDFSEIDPLLREIHWRHAAAILKAAYYAATTDNLYPVYITSFRCAPDSFGVDYFKQIMERFKKPYLILELDEHDSSVGYETRVEAAVRAFENHKNRLERPEKDTGSLKHMDPDYLPKLQGQTIVFPNWDAYTGRLIVSIFKNEGYHAILMEETPETLKKCILTNTGQCIPLNAVGEGFIHTVKKHGLDPANTALWLNLSEIACNIRMYPYHIKKILERNGEGFENAKIYNGELSLFDISFRASTNAYFAYMFGGLLRSIGCKIRPYETLKGSTDKALDQALDILCDAFENGTSKESAVKKAIDLFLEIETVPGNRPKVGIFGDLYARDNAVMNQDLLHFIEDQGGEVVTTPYYKYVKIIAGSYFKKWFKEGKYFSLISNSALLFAMQAMEKKYYKYFQKILDEKEFRIDRTYENILPEYGLLPEHTGESMDNILKIHTIMDEHPDLRLLVQTNPAFCCPGLITEAMVQKIEKKLNIPIVSITYDISGGSKNQVIVPFLKDTGPQTYSHNLKVSV